MRKVLSFIIALVLMASLTQTEAKAQEEQQTTWGAYFASNEGWYEGAEGSIVSQTGTGWIAKLDTIGWLGCWGGYVYQNKEQGYGIIDVQKGKEYIVSFDLMSTECDKWVFFTVGAANQSEQGAYSDWIKLKKGEKYSYNKKFTAQNDAQGVTFGIGGDAGDSRSPDSEYRYGLTDEKNFDEDYNASTTIECSNFSVVKKQEETTTIIPVTTDKVTANKNGDITNIDRPKVKKVSGVKAKQEKNRKVRISWKKIKKVKGYQVCYGVNKKFKKAVVTNANAKRNCKYTKKLKKGKIYYIKVRAYVVYRGEKVYGSWSKIKKVKIK